MNTAELQEAWESSEEDIHVNLRTGEAFYLNRLIASGDEDGNPDYTAIASWMNTRRYWPNVWEVNDHGNVELVSIDDSGEPTYHGGLV